MLDNYLLLLNEYVERVIFRIYFLPSSADKLFSWLLVIASCQPYGCHSAIFPPWNAVEQGPHSQMSVSPEIQSDSIEPRERPQFSQVAAGTCVSALLIFLSKKKFQRTLMYINLSSFCWLHSCIAVCFTDVALQL